MEQIGANCDTSHTAVIADDDVNYRAKSTTISFRVTHLIQRLLPLLVVVVVATRYDKPLSRIPMT